MVSFSKFLFSDVHRCCWAFAGGAIVDAAFKLQKNIVTAQSQEELVDCTSNLGNMGCNGGIMYSRTYITFKI